MAAIDLRGTGRSVHGLKGKGSIQLRNAEIYELPLIVSLLKILNFAEPDPTAFTESDIDFVIDGPHIYFRKLNFSGDAISLLGQGMMNFDTQIQLTFKTIVGRGNLNIPVIKDLFRGTQGQLMAIYVGGTLQEPEQRGEAFPGVNQMLRQLELGLNPASGYQPARPAQRPPRPNMRPSNRIR